MSKAGQEGGANKTAGGEKDNKKSGNGAAGKKGPTKPTKDKKKDDGRAVMDDSIQIANDKGLTMKQR